MTGAVLLVIVGCIVEFLILLKIYSLYVENDYLKDYNEDLESENDKIMAERSKLRIENEKLINDAILIGFDFDNLDIEVRNKNAVISSKDNEIKRLNLKLEAFEYE